MYLERESFAARVVRTDARGVLFSHPPIEIGQISAGGDVTGLVDELAQHNVHPCLMLTRIDAEVRPLERSHRWAARALGVTDEVSHVVSEVVRGVARAVSVGRVRSQRVEKLRHYRIEIRTALPLGGLLQLEQLVDHAAIEDGTEGVIQTVLACAACGSDILRARALGAELAVVRQAAKAVHCI